MAYPDDELPDPATWFSNVFVTAVAIKARIIDMLNALRALPRGLLTSGVDASNTRTLATASTAYAGFAPRTFTVPGKVGENRTIVIRVKARFIQASTTNARFALQAGYNSGATASVGSVTTVGLPLNLTSAVSGFSGCTDGFHEGVATLPSGSQFTAYGVVTRVNNGSATDTADLFYVAVYDEGAA